MPQEKRARSVRRPPAADAVVMVGCAPISAGVRIAAVVRFQKPDGEHDRCGDASGFSLADGRDDGIAMIGHALPHRCGYVKQLQQRGEKCQPDGHEPLFGIRAFITLRYADRR